MHDDSHPLIRSRLLWSQAAVALLALTIVSLMPPVHGAMLIFSLTGESASSIANWAVGERALLIGTGPVGGSLVVSGDRSRLVRAAAAHGAIVVTGAAAGCGGTIA